MNFCDIMHVDSTGLPDSNLYLFPIEMGVYLLTLIYTSTDHYVANYTTPSCLFDALCT
jgi:hypothetical protein